MRSKKQNTLRENDLKMEMENLTRDRDSAKDEVCFLERTLALAELEKLKFEEKLQKSQRKCEELEMTITRLIEEKRVSNDRAERAEELCDKISAENAKMENENNKLIFELNEKIIELKNKNLENERLVGVYQEKYKCLDTMVVKMGREIEDLRREDFEAKRTIDVLRLKKSESDKVAELYQSRLENLSPRIRKIEENIANMLGVKVGDLAGLVNELRSASEEGGNLDFPDSRGKNDSSGNADVVVLWPGVRSVSNSTASQSIGLSNKGAHASGTRLMSGGVRFSKIARSSSASGDIIEIIDSDDETNPNGAADISNTGVGTNVGEKEINFVRSPSSGQKSKRKRTDCMGDLFANTQTPLEKSNGLNDEVSTDSDESCTDSRMDDLIASLES